MHRYLRSWVCAAVLGAGLVGDCPAGSADAAVCLEIGRKFNLTRDISSLQLNLLLFSAADKGCELLARRLLVEGAAVDARDSRGAMPLARAARSGRLVLVDLLVDHGAPINARDIVGSTALYDAAENDRVSVVRRLLEKGADPNLPGRSGVSPLAAAAFKGNLEIVELLLASGSQTNGVDATGKAPILYDAALGFPRIVRRLLDVGVDVNTRYGNDLTALMWAAGYADGAGVHDAENVVALLIDRGAAIDAADNRGRTALMIASELGHAAIVDLLIDRGADTSAKDKDGKRAIDFATSIDVREKLQAR
jgi:ankyrin repeat protein